jgi:hypothetical protein
MRFETKRDYTFLVIFLFVFLIYSCVSVYSIYYEQDKSSIWVLIVVLSVIALLLGLIYKTTFFILEENELICKSLFITRKIPYQNIRRVEKQKGLYAGLKMSTAWKGIVVHYNKYDDLLISPEREDHFILEIEKRKLKLSSQ